MIILISGCGVSSSTVSNFNRQLSAIIQPYTFNYASWEFNTLVEGLKRSSDPGQITDIDDTQSVVDYFSLVAELDSLESKLQVIPAQKTEDNKALIETEIEEVNDQIEALTPVVERTIAVQISQILAEQGIYNPLGHNWFRLPFPPVNFSLESPLYELIISPRDEIQRIKSITLQPDITVSQMQEIEASIDKLNVSSLVVQIGGLGATYPTFVVKNGDLRWTIDTAAHEWLHQYLAFTPLGFGYILDLLGIYQNYDIGTINETVANMFSQEIGSIVYDKYYSQYQDTNDRTKEESPVSTGFDFNGAMRDIRRNVDTYLAQGQIDQAEKYMVEQQQFLASKGYYIRRLNQAYFAFYGTYADGPTSIDPIGPKLRSIRKNSLSLKDFLDTVSKFASSQDLNKAANGLE